ncbi:hypothetical protein ES705_50026 [subsurface metagenome]
MRKDFHPDIKERIDYILRESEVAVNGVIKLELLGGIRTENEYNRLKSRLDSLFYIEATESLWDYSSKQAFDLRRKGNTIPFTDIFIVASAVCEDAVLVHVDSHFDLIAKHIGLKVESFVPLIK